VQDGKADVGEDCIDECVAGLAVGAGVGGVVKLDHQAWGRGARVAEHEVDAFGLDAPPMGLVAARLRFDLDQAGEANLGEDLIASGRGSLKDGEEVALGGGE
jgi:hypothetical protein